MSLRHFLRLVLLGAACVTTSAAASAQSGTIRFIVGLVPGGAVDPYARIIAEHMSKTLGQTIIVENKPGAGGNLSAQMMTEAPANGQMVWVSTQALTEINPNAYSNLRWSIDDFLPIIKGVQAPLVFVAHPSVPATNLAEFVTWAKANRGKLSYASYTAGTPSHFLGYLLNEKFDLDLTHVPYRGSGLQVNGLIAGHSLFGFAQVNSTLPQKRAGALKVFAVTGPERDRSMPDVPAFAELGHPEFTARVWFGLLVKAGTPPDIVNRLTEAAKAAHADPEVRGKLEAQGYDVTAETGPQLLPNIKEQIVRWGKLVKASGFSAEDRGSTR
ncbi:MAG: tripartite tricarboxylate transporter substrate binding protein [Xanthobacteraceae bacterium]|nr:tripartite tricarboxylate transporter substrate binding protein [Xanthobacteraceae bacterium]